MKIFSRLLAFRFWTVALCILPLGGLSLQGWAMRGVGSQEDDERALLRGQLEKIAFQQVSVGVYQRTSSRWLARQIGLRRQNCGATFVSHDLIITAAHCVNREFPCEGAGFSAWKNDPMDLQQSECAFMPQIDWQMDYAIFQVASENWRDLKPVSIRPTDAPPIRYGELVGVISNNPVTKKVIRICKFRNEAYFPDRVKPLSEIKCSDDQPIIGGDSGSPVLDSQGRLIGILVRRNPLNVSVGYFAPIREFRAVLDRELLDSQQRQESQK